MNRGPMGRPVCFMKTLVTGATGFVGREVIAHLQAAGHAPVVLSRSPHTRDAQELADRCRAEVRSGNVLELDTLKEAMSGVEGVIHLVGIISEVGRNTFESVHVHGTQNVVNAARAAGVKRFVQMSALGTRPDAVSRYHRSKWDGEEVVRHSGFDWTIFRPSIIYGPGDHFVNQFAEMSNWSPFLPVIGCGEATFQPISVGLVARCFVQALTEPRAVGQTFDLVGPEILTFNQILSAILQVIEKDRTKIHIPVPLARGMATMMEWTYPSVVGKAAPLNRDQIIMLGEKTIGTQEPAYGIFEMRPVLFLDGISWLRKKR